MTPNNSKGIFQKLLKVITGFFSNSNLFNVNGDELQEIFFANYAIFYEIAFDLNLDIGKLKKFIQETKAKPQLIETAAFLLETLEHESTYILLNYFAFRFINACLDLTKKEHIVEVDEILKLSNITKQEIKIIASDYKKLITVNNKSLIHE